MSPERVENVTGGRGQLSESSMLFFIFIFFSKGNGNQQVGGETYGNSAAGLGRRPEGGDVGIR